MIHDEFYAAAAAWGTWALVAVTLGAVYVGWRAAKTANATFRLEAEPRLLVSVVDEARIFARFGTLYRLDKDHDPNMPVETNQMEPLDQVPVYLLDGRLNSEKLRTIKSGFDIRTPTFEEMNKTQQSSVWPALRVEIRNVGRSPAIQVGLTWAISASVFNDDLHERFEHGVAVITRTDQATVVIEGVGPNDVSYIWLGNSIGTQFALTLNSPGYQRDPLQLESGKRTPISAIGVSTFRLPGAERSV